MRVLVVLTQPPLPEGGAPGKTALGLLRGLAAHGLDVRAVAAQRHFTAAGAVPAGLDVEVVPVEAASPWRARIDRYRRPRTELGGVFAAHVRELALDADVVQLEEVETAPCDHGVERPSVLHVHYLVRRDRDLGAPWRREFRDVFELRRAERIAVRTHPVLAASSPLVAEDLRRDAPRAEVVLAPLTLDPAYYPPAPLDGPPVAGLIGTAAWPPTAEAMHMLVRHVWPLVRARVPGARLLVAGRGTDRLGLDGPGVETVGEVESAAAFLQSLSILLFPQRRGSGMKVKTLEALASGVPVVTTAAGAEGIAPNDGIVVAADPAVLADQAAGLLADAEERHRRGAAAREAFAGGFAPEPATRPLAELYARLSSR